MKDSTEKSAVGTPKSHMLKKRSRDLPIDSGWAYVIMIGNHRCEHTISILITQ